MLDPLALQPGLDERRVGIEVLPVEVDSGCVVSVHRRLVQCRAASAQRVEHGQLAGEHVTGEG
jgi:hypothetical protein